MALLGIAIVHAEQLIGSIPWAWRLQTSGMGCHEHAPCRFDRNRYPAACPRQALARIQAPAGHAHARTPEEIALPVIAEIVLVRRSRADREATLQPEGLAAVRAEPLRLVGRMR